MAHIQLSINGEQRRDDSERIVLAQTVGFPAA
jgi:hypothetical protein